MKKVLFFATICMTILLTSCQNGKEAEEVSELTGAPSPTEKVEPIEIDIINEGTLQIREIVINAPEMEIVFAYGNVLVTCVNGKYGAMDYEGQVLVENLYEQIWVRPNGDGDFALGNTEKVRIFNARGEALLDITAPREMFINERILTYIVDNGEGFGTAYAYNLEEGKQIAAFEAACISVASENKIYYSDRFGLEAIGLDGSSQMLWDYWKVYKGEERIIPTLYEGMRGEYGAVSCSCTSGYYIGLIRSDGQDLILVDVDELTRYAGWESYDECGIFTYQDEGVRYANYEKKIVIFLDKGEESKFFFIDFEKAQKRKSKGFTTYAQEQAVANLSDVIIGEFDSICLSPSGTHAAMKDGKCLYFDNEGRVLGEYKQNMYFRREHGVILDDNNEVYLVDKKCQKVFGGIQADWITVSGNAFGIIRDNQKIYWLVE